MEVKFHKAFTWLFYLAVLCFYLLFPTQNHSIDAWGYAGNVKWEADLFAPHHLLYTITGWLWDKGIQSLFPEWLWIKGIQWFNLAPHTMLLLLALNAIVGLLAILVLSRILRQLGKVGWERIGLLGIAAFSFGFWRFATENETYIFPVLFSLLGTYYFIRFQKDKKTSNAFLSGLFAAIACLYHQIHVFWWLGILIGLIGGRQFKSAVLYALPAILVPLAYIWVLIGYNGQSFTISNLWHFTLHDFYSGGAGYAIGLRHFALGGINLVRTFIQVHGIMSHLSQNAVLRWVFLLVPVLVACTLFIRAVWKSGLSKSEVEDKAIFRTHVLIFILQLLFAIYNVGNAEFMAMLPALLVICLACTRGIRPIAFQYMAGALLVWNLCLGVLPFSLLRLSADIEIAWSKEAQTFLVASEHGIISNYIYYEEGQTPSSVLKPPSYYIERDKPLDSLKAAINNRLNQGLPVYTDCTGRPSLVSRASLVNAEADAAFFKDYALIPVATYPTNAGPHTVFRVEKR